MCKTTKATVLLAIIIISATSGIIANRYIFPQLAATKFFAKYAFFKKTTEDVTVINKTEQVFVKEDTSVSKIASQAAPSVVNIISSTNINPDKKNQPLAQPLIKSSTGMIVTSDGLIMAYAQALISDNASYKIMTSENNVFDATLVDIDSYSNLAFLKITASNLPAISFGNSDDVVAGEKIIAIGNNSGDYNAFFSAGILSNLNYEQNLSDKTIASSEKMEGVFGSNLTNQENYVGGPVVDYSGQVIGLIGATARDEKTFFFQIPSNKVKLVLDKEIQKELNTNPTLGVYYLSITKAYALVNNLPVQSGALIYSPSAQQGLAVIANSPAANAGLKLNDIVTAVAGEKIDQLKTLPDLLYKHKKGEQIELTILRNLQEMQITVQL